MLLLESKNRQVCSERDSICFGRLAMKGYCKDPDCRVQEAKYAPLWKAAESRLISKYFLDKTFFVDFKTVRVNEKMGGEHILLPIAFLGNASTAFSSCGIL